MKIEITIDDHLHEKYDELSKILQFDLLSFIKNTIEDLLKNKLEDLREEIENNR